MDGDYLTVDETPSNPRRIEDKSVGDDSSVVLVIKVKESGTDLHLSHVGTDA